MKVIKKFISDWWIFGVIVLLCVFIVRGCVGVHQYQVAEEDREMRSVAIPHEVCNESSIIGVNLNADMTISVSCKDVRSSVLYQPNGASDGTN